jgi:hypothetical protein
MSDAAPHSSLVEVERRHVTDEEQGWIRDIVSANPTWADMQFEDLFVVAECTCGCRSVVLEAPENVQNPGLIGHQNLVGAVDLKVRFDAGEDFVSILLHYAEGSLSMLEVIWYNFPAPVPRKWIELDRDLRIGFTAAR